MIGETLSHYRILGEIGAGGMGIVYEAQDEILRRTVALKVLHQKHVGDEEHRRRFLREAQSAAALSHPNIAAVYEAGDCSGTFFIAMERVRGRNLRALLREDLNPSQVVRIATQIAAGMAHAHGKNIIHRDLKPENVMLTHEGQVKILDFGLARIWDKPAVDVAGPLSQMETELPELTAEGTFLGTPDYVSPEQARGQPVDTRSDTFSFGSLLYELLTGRQPFRGATPLDTLGTILYGQPRPPSQLDPRIPLELERVVEKCLRKDPAERYQETSELVADLLRLEDELGPGRTRVRLQPTPTIRHLFAAVVALAVLFPITDRPGHVAERTVSGKLAVGDGAAGAPHDWILVADFQTAGGDSALAVAARELVTAALGQSRIVTPITRSQLKRGLALAQIPERSAIVGEVARQLAYRAAARTYLEGRIDPFPRGYSVIFSIRDSETGGLLMTLRDVAQNADALITTVDRLTRDLRRQLGERRGALRATRPLREVITPSLEAYENYVRAVQLQNQRDYAASNTFLRRALELDGEFASADLLLGINHYNMQALDSAQAAFDQALARPKRLLDSERLRLQVTIATRRYELPEALRLNELLLGQENAAIVSGDLINRGTLLFMLGRYEEALDAQVRACDSSPFGPSQLLLYNRFRTLVQLGRRSEAAGLAKGLSGAQSRLAALELAVAQSDWMEAQKLAAGFAADPDPLVRHSAGVVLASIDAVRGAAGAAGRRLDSLQATAPAPFYADLTRIARDHLSFLSGAAVGTSSPGADTTAAGCIVGGIRAAIANDTSSARAYLVALRRRPGEERRRYEIDTRSVEGWIAARAGRWQQVIQLLEPTTTGGPGPWVTGRLPARWLVAEAHERLGHLEEAAAAFELVLSPDRLHHDVWVWRAVPWAFAHRRLVLLYARLGRGEQARRHWQALHENFVAPDPTFGPWIEEARAAIAALGGIP